MISLSVNPAILFGFVGCEMWHHQLGGRGGQAEERSCLIELFCEHFVSIAASFGVVGVDLVGFGV